MTNYEWLVTRGKLKNFVRNLYSLCADAIIDKYKIATENNIGEFYEEQKLRIITDWLQKEHKEPLKPCPFCGGDAEIINTQPYIYSVKCKICKVETNDYGRIDAAEERWNRRVEK